MRGTMKAAIGNILFALLLVLATDVSGAAPGSFGYVLQADLLARDKASAVKTLAACDRDWLILDDAYTAGQPWTRTDLEAIRAGHPGRKILAYQSIGEAEDYRPYWRASWLDGHRPGPGAPAWLGPQNPEWKGNYRVKYWMPAWQEIALARIGAAMSSGFDGVYLDIVDAFETYEQRGDTYLDDRINPETGQSYRRDMVDWVKAIAARTRQHDPSAPVIAQNGSQLLAQPDFLSTVSGIGIEDLFTEGAKRQSPSHTREILADLAAATAAGKPVLIIEYPATPTLSGIAREGAHRAGFVWLLTDRPLSTLGKSGRD